MWKCNFKSYMLPDSWIWAGISLQYLPKKQVFAPIKIKFISQQKCKNASIVSWIKDHSACKSKC